MVRCLVTFLLACLLGGCASGESPRRGTSRTQGKTVADGPLRCGGSTFALTAPEGWRSAHRAARVHGMLAAFHPAEQTWDSARVVMLARCDPGARDSRQLIARDKERFSKRSSLVMLGEADPIRTTTGQRLELRTFSGGPDGRNEAVAYLEVSGGMVRLVLRAANQHSFETHLPAFEALLGSLRSAD